MQQIYKIAKEFNKSENRNISSNEIKSEDGRLLTDQRLLLELEEEVDMTTAGARRRSRQDYLVLRWLLQ